ncbi:MAG: hypothetical protein J5779_02235, partial [Clostridia bacterium]|nr:hypothetical protein [Clostridia bacterium]
MGIWIFIVIAVLCLIAVIYFCRPILKKIKFPKIKFKKREKKQKNIIAIDKKEEKKVDPDVQVEENNLDYDGFFRTDFSSKENDDYGLSETVNHNYDDLFNDLFFDAKPTKKTEEIISELKDSELKDYFSEDYVSSDEKDIAKIIQD